MSSETTQASTTETTASATTPSTAATPAADIKTEDAPTSPAARPVQTLGEMRKAAAGKKAGASKKMVIDDDEEEEEGGSTSAARAITATKAATPTLPTKVSVKSEAAASATSAAAPKKTAAAVPPKKRKRDESDDEGDKAESDEDDEEDDDDEEDFSDDDDDDEDFKKKKGGKKNAKSPAKAKKGAAAKKAATPKKSAASTPAKKKVKTEDDDDAASPPAKAKKSASKKASVKKEPKEEGAEGTPTGGDVYKWWERDPDDETVWKKTLTHHGVLFPPAYEPHGVKMNYAGEPVELPAEAEEVATFFARYLDTPHVQKPQFCANFFKDFLKILNKKSKTKHKIEKFELCDFRPIHAYLEAEKEKRKNRSKEEKEKEKKAKAEQKEKYGYAMVDGRREPLGNYMIEPPGLFLGRGDHPKTGRIKKRITPADVTLNLDAEAAKNPPPCPPPYEGEKWGNIVNNQEVAWIATWRENIADNNKYVLFAASSSIRGKSDRDKFETARQLSKQIDAIRAKYEEELDSSELKIRQRATAMWVIDRLALRVGNEKGEDEADTVGCCSLRVEHVKLHAPNEIEFDFLGKDSMRYHNTVKVAEKVFKNFKTFCEGKAPTQDIFDQLTTTFLNKHLTSCMPGLTAKVFRTFNASFTLQKELKKLTSEVLAKMTPDEKVLAFNRANREVAILCNHQRTVNAKSHDSAMGKIQEKIQELEEQKAELEAALGGKKKPVKKEKKEDKEDGDAKSSKKRKRDDDDDGGEDAPDAKKRKIPDDPDKIKKKIKEIDGRIAKWEVKKEEKEDLKTVALSTSKINYIDPRITIAWCKKVGIDIKKVFSKGVRDKFPWAFAEVDSDPNYQF